MLRKFFFKLCRIVSIDYFFKRIKPNRLYALMFHRINDDNFPFYPAVPTKVFAQICSLISKKFSVISFADADGYFKKTRKPAIIITFDDGHYDILENAYPILEKYKLKFNINITTESLETGLPNESVIIYDALNATKKNEYSNAEIYPESVRIIINKSSPSKTELEFVKLFQKLNKQQARLAAKDIVSQLSNGPLKLSRMLSKEDIAYLSINGAEIGSHTHSHPVLTNIDIPEIEYELSHSKEILEKLCGKRIDIIALPQGIYNDAVIKKSFEAGYKYILLTQDKENVMDNISDNIFYRIGLYYKTTNENLAKIFGFHQAVYNFKI